MYSMYCVSFFIYLHTAATPLYAAAFGQGTGAIIANSIMCTGNEPGLFNCSYDLNHNCGHASDAGVRCTISTSGSCENCTAISFVDS